MKPLWIAITGFLFSGLLFPCLHGQVKLYESTFNGGVVGGGYSIGATIVSGSGSFTVAIPVGSTIRRAYLIGSRVGPSPDVTITLNGAPFTFNAGNNITSGFNTIYGGSSGVHAIDVTASINPLTTNYTIAVPSQSTVSNKYTEFYLYIAFDNAGLPAVSSAIFLNNTTLSVSSYSWTLATTNPVLNSSNVGFAIMGGYAAAGSDCENVNVNGTALGSFGGQDFNAASQWGCMAGFQYYNNALTGYGDDNANQAIAGTDALSNIQAVIPASTSSIPVTFSHCGGGSDNHVWAVFLTWAGVILDQNELSFSADGKEDHVALAWNTHGVNTNGNFVVERKTGDLEFVSIGEVAPNHQTEYQFNDLAPAQGENLYRLRFSDAQGTAFYSEVQSVRFSGEVYEWAFLSPNPVARGEQLLLKWAGEQNIRWNIVSLSEGRTALVGSESGVTQTEIPTFDLAPGTYALQIWDDGGKTQAIRFTVLQ